MSGRTLRRLPVLAHASYVGLPIQSSALQPPPLAPGVPIQSNGKASKGKTKKGEQMRKLVGPMTDVDLWLDAMVKVVESQIGDRSKVDAL